MSDSTRQRLQDLIALLALRPVGLTTPEIAEHFGVTRQTAYNDIKRLEKMGVAVWQDGDQYGVDPEYFHQVTLTPAQAWFMYLPLRRMVRAQLHRLPLVKSLLYQVATLFSAEIADQLTPESADEDEGLNKLLIDLVEAWRTQRYAEIRYRPLNAPSAKRYTVAPLWFEPAVWTDSFYMISALQAALMRDDQTRLMPLKLNRVQEVKLLAERFDRPSASNLLGILEHTWGIWVGEGDAVQVQLRFHSRQYDRLRETRWHPSQTLTLAPDGMVLWEATISEPQEMLPWIRSWGADVEVLEPDSIRQQIASEAAATARLYGMVTERRSFF